MEEENLEIVRMVKAVKMDNRELTAFLKAYASGLITLPDGMMEDVYKRQEVRLVHLVQEVDGLRPLVIPVDDEIEHVAALCLHRDELLAGGCPAQVVNEGRCV